MDYLKNEYKYWARQVRMGQHVDTGRITGFAAWRCQPRPVLPLPRIYAREERATIVRAYMRAIMRGDYAPRPGWLRDWAEMTGEE